MLEEIKKEQTLFYNIMVTSLKNDKISHAYLFDTNNNSKSFNMILFFIKSLMCTNLDILSVNNCNKCNICKNVENNSLFDLTIINPVNNVITKEKILEIEKLFSTKSISNNRRIYVINGCEKMNLHASNALLKFLEEPAENIIAILVTNNVNEVLETIKSRCQLIKFNREVKIVEKDDNQIFDYLFATNSFTQKMQEEQKKNIVNDIIEFLNLIEINSFDGIIYLNKYLGNYLVKEKNITPKENIDIILNLMLYVYFDILKFIVNPNFKTIFNLRDQIFECSIKNNSIEKLEKKIKILLKYIQINKYNVNANLLLDNLIIELGGV